MAEPSPQIGDFVPFFKAFCNGTRASLVEQLLSGERCVCELTSDGEASQPLVSHHLAILRDAGFLLTRSEGTRTYYSIDWERFDAALAAFRDFVAERRTHPHPGPGCQPQYGAARAHVGRPVARDSASTRIR